MQCADRQRRDRQAARRDAAAAAVAVAVAVVIVGAVVGEIARRGGEGDRCIDILEEVRFRVLE